MAFQLFGVERHFNRKLLANWIEDDVFVEEKNMQLMLGKATSRKAGRTSVYRGHHFVLGKVIKNYDPIPQPVNN